MKPHGGDINAKELDELLNKAFLQLDPKDPRSQSAVDVVAKSVVQGRATMGVAAKLSYRGISIVGGISIALSALLLPGAEMGAKPEQAPSRPSPEEKVV